MAVGSGRPRVRLLEFSRFVSRNWLYWGCCLLLLNSGRARYLQGLAIEDQINSLGVNFLEGPKFNDKS